MTKKYHQLTQDQIDEILQAYAETQSTRLTADRLGLNIQRVQSCVKRAGLHLSGRRDNACVRNRELIVRLVADGASLSEIGRQVGTNKRHVKTFLERECIAYFPFDQSGKNNSNWRGGRRIDKDGYVLIHSPSHPHCDRHGYMREHRLVMEEHLGRYLLPSEVVHHRDDDHQKNAIENLKLYGSNGEHLAETLAGQVPNWTEDGKRRISEAVRRPRGQKQKTIRPQ